MLNLLSWSLLVCQIEALATDGDLAINVAHTLCHLNYAQLKCAEILTMQKMVEKTFIVMVELTSRQNEYT